PVNYRLRAGELAYVLNDSGAGVVWVGPEHVQVVEAARSLLENGPRLIALRGDAPAGWLRLEDLLAGASEDPPVVNLAGLGASMVHTPGTTGQPKGGLR